MLAFDTTAVHKTVIHFTLKIQTYNTPGQMLSFCFYICGCLFQRVIFVCSVILYGYWLGFLAY